MAEGTLTNAQMQAVINAGGSVHFRQSIIYTIADLPTDAEIDAYYNENVAAGQVGTPPSQLTAKVPVRLATTVQIDLTGHPDIDNTEALAGYRILVKNQDDASENGIYVAAAGAWARADDTLYPGIIVIVTEGDTQHDTLWTISSDEDIIIGDNPIEFSLAGGAGAGPTVPFSEKGMIMAGTDGIGGYSGVPAPGAVGKVLTAVDGGANDWGLSWEDPAAPAGVLLAANNLDDLTNPGDARDALGLGTASLRAAGTLETNVPVLGVGGRLSANRLPSDSATTGDITGALNTHVAAGDPHPAYALESALGTAAAATTGVAVGNVPVVGGGGKLDPSIITLPAIGIADIPTSLLEESTTIILDGGGSPITTGIKADIPFIHDCLIIGVLLFADQSGSVSIELWKDTYANFPPTVADKITASAPAAISAATKATADITTWTKTITAGDVVRLNIASAATITRLTAVIQTRRTP